MLKKNKKTSTIKLIQIIKNSRLRKRKPSPELTEILEKQRQNKEKKIMEC